MQNSPYVVEPGRQVPIAYEADVVVAGGGVSGLFAALAAAKEGARTVLVDRFGFVGGNIGPGYSIGGGVGPFGLRRGHPSLPREFFRRVEQLANTGNYAALSQAVSYVAFQMAEEAGLELILSVQAGDPIMDAGTVRGLFIEGKSGRTAIKADIVIDSTGDASIAARASASLITHVSRDYSSYGWLLENKEPAFSHYNECGLWYLIGGVEWDEYNAFLATEAGVSDADRSWADEHFVGPKVVQPLTPLLPLMRKAWERGEFSPVQQLNAGAATLSSTAALIDCGRGIAAGRACIGAGSLRMDDMKSVSLLEGSMRMLAFERVQFMRKYVPGFLQAYLLAVSPFLGARGGVCIAGEHTVSLDDAASGVQFDDVLFRCYFRRPNARPEWVETGYEIPYRCLLPKGMANLFVTGRGAAYIRRGHDGTGMRVRAIAMALGQAAGTAAALCSQHKVSTFSLDVTSLQKRLLELGFDVGDPDRCRELNLL